MSPTTTTPAPAPLSPNATVEIAPLFLRTPLLRPLAPAAEPEPAWKRYLFLAIAAAIVAGFLFFLFSFWAPGPGRPGIDENAYLVGGKNIAQHASTGFHPSDDYQYVGMMWLRTRDQTILPPAWLPGPLRRALSVHTQAGWFYPKYPFGLSLLDAIAIRIGGLRHGRQWALAIAPASLALAIAAMFFLTRELAGSFSAILAMLVLGTCATALQLSLLADSHTPDLCVVCWGMTLLVWWWRTGRTALGAAAGLLLGFAVTIRYTEALLLFPLYPLPRVLADTHLDQLHPHLWLAIQALSLLPIGPLGWAVILSIRWRYLRSYARAAVPLIGWAIPVAILLIYNWRTLGHLTGYDVTDESSGFTTAEFLKKWEFAVYELYAFGVFALMPLGVAGLVLLFRRSWCWGLMLGSWCVPGVLLYIAYYWGEDLPGVAYLRFFLTLLPPLIIAALWMLGQASAGAGRAPAPRRRWPGSIAGPLAAGILAASAAAIGLRGSLPDLVRQHRGNLNFAYSTQCVRAAMGPAADATGNRASLLFTGDGLFPQLLPHLQFMTNCDCYPIDAFEVRAAGGFGLAGLLQKGESQKHLPVLLDQNRVDDEDRIRFGKTDADFAAAEHHLITTALHAGRKVFALLTPVQARYYATPFSTDGLRMTKLDQWTEPCRITFPTMLESMQHPLAPPTENDQPLIDWQPQTYQIFEIRLAAPPPPK